MHEIRSTLVRREQHVPLASKPSAGASGGGLAGIRIRRQEARKVDQRREDRHLDVVNQAVLRHQRRVREVRVLNVSSRGAMVACDLVPRIGARLDIQFADCNRTQCFVRWVRDGRIGLEFARETLVVGANGRSRGLVSGRREGEHATVEFKAERAPRHCLMLRGELHWPDGSMPIRLRNISAEGAMLEGIQNVEPPVPVVLELPGGVAVEGRVRWCRSRQIGVRFDAPFDVAALGQAQREEAPAQPGYLKPDYLKSDGQADSPWAARCERLRPQDL